MDKKSVNLFWTGGWHSTFRLIQLVLLHQKVVQPYYLIDHYKKSTLFKTCAMGCKVSLPDIPTLFYFWKT